MSKALDLAFIVFKIQIGTSIIFPCLIMLIFTVTDKILLHHTHIHRHTLTSDEHRCKTEESGGGELKVSSKDEVGPASWGPC